MKPPRQAAAARSTHVACRAMLVDLPGVGLVVFLRDLGAAAEVVEARRALLVVLLRALLDLLRCARLPPLLVGLLALLLQLSGTGRGRRRRRRGRIIRRHRRRRRGRII